MEGLNPNGNRLSYKNLTIEFDFEIREARLIQNVIVVIFNATKAPNSNGQFQNCRAFNMRGELLWIAEHPTNETADFYLSFAPGKELELWNFAGYKCLLNLKDGRLLEAHFTK